MSQTWSELLFAHWPVAAAQLRDYVPQQLQIDEFDGTAWVGVIPFRMTNVVPRGFPPIPYVSNFLELNVRTYVIYQGRPGVYFFSLDASNPLAVIVARSTYFLPYFQAAMSCSSNGDYVEYSSKRTHPNSSQLIFQGRYRPVGPVESPSPGSLDYFLTERYCLYVPRGKNHLFRADIHHIRWPLQKAEAEIHINTMVQSLGLDFTGKQPLLHFVKSLDTLEWLPTRCSSQ